jgi:hypothetical protein
VSDAPEADTSDRKLSDDERQSLIFGSLRRIKSLQKVAGEEPSLSLYIAIELLNVFNNSALQADLKSRKFPTPAMYKDGRKMELLIPLVGFQLHSDPPSIAFLPNLSRLGQGMQYDYIPFKDWWKKEIAHQPMRQPTDPEKVDVIDLTRFGVVRSIRNKLAAHHDNIRPRVLDEIEKSMLVSGWRFDLAGKSYQIGDGSFTVSNPYMYALLSQIGYEALRAFDMADSL